MPVWRNWQTRTTQNRVPLECRFDPDHRYHKLAIECYISRLLTNVRSLFVFLHTTKSVQIVCGEPLYATIAVNIPTPIVVTLDIIATITSVLIQYFASYIQLTTLALIFQ